MARANQEFFVRFRKEINEDNTPPTTLELLECGSVYFPGLEPENSLAYKDAVNAQRDMKFTDRFYGEGHSLEQEDYIAIAEGAVEELKAEEIRIEAIRTLVTEIIAYAEKFPYEQNEKAEVIKEVLYAKSVNGIIPLGVLDDVLRERLNNLGRKEQHYQIKSLVEVSGNDKVILGGLNNG